MKVLSQEKKLCLSCMEEHEVQYVEIQEENMFRGVLVQYPAHYEYCSNTEEFTTYDETLETNDIAFKNAYRAKMDLLTSEDIVKIRHKYGVSQKDFSLILGWGSSTITRYESHQVQDIVHDDVLRKVRKDPCWFIELIERSKDQLSPKAYAKYMSIARKVYYSGKNYYLVDAILALYANLEESEEYTGGRKLDLAKVVEVINYLAQEVDKLHKVKLMKMLWFSDFLNYKLTNTSLTGLAYKALPMGAVPVGHEEIVLLEGINYNEILYTDYIGYEFKPVPNFNIKHLSGDELRVINDVLSIFKHFTTQQIVDKMHEEEAYKKTKPMEIISYKYAQELSI